MDWLTAQKTTIVGLAVLAAGAGLLFFGKIDTQTFLALLGGSGVLVVAQERKP